MHKTKDISALHDDPADPACEVSSKKAGLGTKTIDLLSGFLGRTGKSLSWLAVSSTRLRNRPQFLELESCLSALPAHEANLQTSIKHVGERFTKIADTLEEMMDASTHLVKEGERLLLIASGRSEGETLLESAIGLLQTPLNYLETCADCLERLILRLQHSEEQIEKILGLRNQLEATLAPLTYVQTLYKIESATLPLELKQMFVAVSQDIARLESNVAGAFKEKFSMLGSMHTTISEVLHLLREALPIHRRLGGEKKRQMDKTLVDLQQELELNASRDLRLTVATRSIVDQVGQVVVGLQFHDIVAQKSTHLGQSLKQSSALRQHLQATPEAQLVRTLAELKEANLLQSAHLFAIRADLVEASQKISEGIQTTLTYTQQLDESCVALTELNKVTVAPDGMIQILLDTIAETRTLVKTTLGDAEKAHGSLKSIEEMAHSLTSTMTDLSVTMQLIALNAQIQAIQLGHGTGLEILAANTVAVSADTTAFSNDALTRLESLATSLTEMTQDFAALSRTGVEHREMLENRGSEMEKELHDLRDRSLNALSAVDIHTRSIQKLSSDVLALCEPDHFTQSHLSESAAHLKQIEKVLASIKSRQVSAAGETDPSSWERKYTMASEREIHAAVLGKRSLTPAASMVDHAEASIELFDTVLPSETAAITNLSSGVEPLAREDADLGANVDLF